ncbi:MFS-type transporter clz9-like [Vanessa cardui]|uniref:MFS-type transporter clz9-like n=1 Tax=Vanessa cardui TaxID=171605 RepID=UPI001F142C79|nr:MFS-type transporter clz9-like [Vanessa cardui]
MVRTYTPKNATRQVVDEESMQSAIQDVVQGVLSYRKAANKYNLKLSTLESRVKTYRKRNDAEGSSNRTFNSKYTSFQVFSSEEEKLLNDYIIKCCKMHYRLTTIQTRKLAYEYTKSLSLKYPAKWEEDKMAGKEWMYGFRRRNPEISLRKPENTSAARSFAFNKTSVSEFYTNLKTVLERHPLTADRIFNFDESGVSTVLATPKVLAPECQKQVGQIVSAERGELVTFGGIISASGNTIPPLFVFPRVHYRDNFLEGAPEGSLGAANRSRWINSFIFVSVLKHIQKHTLCTKDNPILLLCDNHESHVSLEAINYAKENGIIYLSFPPHTSHRLQPLDVGVFAALSKLKIAFNNWHTMNPGKALTIYNTPKLVTIAYFESFTAKNIISGFNKPGIWPLNELAFGDEDFAPTEVYTSRNIENVTSTQNIVEDLSAPTPQPVVSDICHPSTSGTQDFLAIPPESTEQTINSPLITDDDELQRNNLDANLDGEPDALNISPTRQIVAPLKTVLTPEAIRP